MDIDLDTQNISAQQPGSPCRYNGHVIVFCEWFGELHVECAACDKEETRKVPPEWYDMGPNQQAAYMLVLIGRYSDECPASADTMREVVREQTLQKHTGKIATTSNKRRIEEEIEQELPEMYTATVSFEV